MQDAYSPQWNLTLERSVWLQTGLRVSHIGLRSRQLPYRRNVNQPQPGPVPFNANRRPFPQYNTITYADSGANQSYNALQVEAIRRLASGLAFNAHYTWAKNLTDSLDSAALGAVIQNTYDGASERGNETYTPRQRFLLDFVYDLPIGRGRRGLSSLPAWLDAVAGGWTFSGLYFWRTGYWITPAFSGSDPSNTGQAGGRPDRVKDGNLPSEERSLQRWFDPTAFVVPPNGRFGNAGVNTIETPGANSFALGVYKWFPLHERLKLRLNASFRNLFNHPTLFGNPANNISTPGQVARITGFQIALEESPNRQVYGGLRLEW